MDNFLRIHEINIWNLKFRKSRQFRFRNQKARDKFTNKLILEYEPSVYRKFEDEFNRDLLHIKVSWTIVAFILSFTLALAAFVFLTNPKTSHSIAGISIIFFLTAIYLKNRYIRFAHDIDFIRTLITDDVISKAKKELESTTDPS